MCGCIYVGKWQEEVQAYLVTTVYIKPIPNNQYQATASGVFRECCEKCKGKCDKNGVITVSIYANVKSEILMFISVENIVVQLNRLLYISSYMKWSWDNKPLHGSDAIHVCPVLMSWLPMFSREADWGCYVMLG